MILNIDIFHNYQKNMYSDFISSVCICSYNFSVCGVIFLGRHLCCGYSFNLFLYFSVFEDLNFTMYTVLRKHFLTNFMK